ncbi:MAG: serine hydrolase [Candidatus Aminicenantes bacterium]|nr:serine hydrolase [Candidatus Aminicenantes bacterium]
MKFNVKKNILFSITIFFLFGTLSIALYSNPELQKKEIDKYLSGIYKADMPGAAVLAVKNGKVILRKGYGMADMELNVPMRTEMVFRIGSITKQFTSVGIMMLVEEGKVKLEDLITVYLPEYPLKGKKVTVRHLLNHTSGIKSYTSMPEFGKIMRTDIEVEKLIDVFKEQPFDFEPGEKYLYNNSGYILLGAIIEKVSGLKYADFIKTRIFDKAGMNSSIYGEAAAIIKNRAKGYGRNDKGVVNSSYLSMTLPYAAGSLLSTVDDLYKWNRSLSTGKLISKKSLKKVYKRTSLNNGEEISYAFGFMNIDFHGYTQIHHGGGINGFITHEVYIPEEEIFVTVLTNSTGNKISPQFVSQWITTLLLGKSYSEDAGRILTEKELNEYVGIYEISKDDERSVTREGNKLFTQRTGSIKQEAFNKSIDKFFFKKSFTWFTFERDKRDGKVIAMTMHSLSGKDFAKKIAKKVKIKKAVDIDKSIYKELAGRYQMQGFLIDVSINSGKLMIQATGQKSAQIFPLSELRYFLKVVDAEIEFIKDPDGKVTGLILYQGKVKLEGKRL